MFALSGACAHLNIGIEFLISVIISLISANIFKSFYLCIYFERERESVHASRGGAEREGESISRRLLTVGVEPYTGPPMNPEIMT